MPDTPDTTDTGFQIKVNDRTFLLDGLTLGDWRMLKNQFDLSANDILLTVTLEDGGEGQMWNIADPNVLVGLIVAALSHERPEAPIADLIKEVEAFDLAGFEFVTGDSEEPEAADPTKAGDDASEATDAPSKSGKSAKTRKSSGKQTGQKS